MTSEVPVTSVRPSRRRNNRRKQKKTGPEMIQLADTGKVVIKLNENYKWCQFVSWVGVPSLIQVLIDGTVRDLLQSKQTLEHDELLGEPNATSETPVTAIRSGRRRNNQRRPKKIEHFEVDTEAVQMTVNRKVRIQLTSDFF